MICLTETWLHPSILDSVLFLSNYVLFRRDRLSSIGGGVCIYVNAKLHCRRLTDFESPSIESLWLSIRPRYLPRSISVILLAVIYHSTSAGAMENSELYDHIQSNVDSYLSRHPDALVMVTGDFNPVSTGFDDKLLKRLSDLRQIVNVPTRNDAILDWCLVNLKDPIFLFKQLPPIGSSDHNALLVGPYVQRSTKPENKKVLKRDLRDSSLRSFGRWITTYDWKDVYETAECDRKFNKFNEILSNMINYFCPIKPSKVRSSDKPWMTPSLKFYMKKRQMAFYEYGKNSYAFKYWRNKVQYAVKQARKTYYSHSVDKLKNTNSTRWWKEIKSVGSLSSQVSWHSQLLSETIPTCGDLAEYYNDYLVGLTSHFNPLQDRNPGINLSVPSNLLVSTSSVLAALQRIKQSKSCGPDLIPNKILKTFAFELAPVVCDIYNTSMRQEMLIHVSLFIWCIYIFI